MNGLTTHADLANIVGKDVTRGGTLDGSNIVHKDIKAYGDQMSKKAATMTKDNCKEKMWAWHQSPCTGNGFAPDEQIKGQMKKCRENAKRDLGVIAEAPLYGSVT